MHIPDPILDAKTAIAAGAVSAAGLAVALRQTRKHLPRSRMPLMGVTGAFIFAAQMLNFPVAAGTSGHLVGGVLVAALLGPSAALIVISSVLIVQCLLFADGGMLALGANILNMGLISAVGGYGIYWLVARIIPGQRGRLVAAAFASWCAVVWAAATCAGELALSGAAPWSLVFPAMTGVHMLIGIGEAIITALVLASISATRPELLDEHADEVRPQYEQIVAYGLLISLGLALFISPLASKWPDGLDHVSMLLGFHEREIAAAPPTAIAPDYVIPGIQSATIATSVAGAVGTVIVFGLAILLARILSRRTDASAATPELD